MVDVPRLDAYHFYEQEWEDMDELRAAFEWQVPNTFNLARYLCDRWANGDGHVAMYAVGDGSSDRYSFDYMRATSNRLANYLSERGITRGDHIAVTGSQTVETMLTLLAAWKLGAIAVPVSSLFGTQGLAYRLSDAGVSAFVADEEGLETYRSLDDDQASVNLVLSTEAFRDDNVIGFWEAIAVHDDDFDPIETEAEDPAVIIYTSGTTGRAKGVVHAHRFVLGQLPGYITRQNNMQIDDGDVYYSLREWSWIGIINVLATLFYGNAILGHHGGKFDAAETLSLLDRYEVTTIDAPPTAIRKMQQLEDTDRFDLDSVRVIPLGGEAVGQSVVEWIERTFPNAVPHVGYGQTEAALSIGECHALGQIAPSDGGNIMGAPLPGHRIALLDIETGDRIEKPEIEGELAIHRQGNPLIFLEYLNQPEKTTASRQGGWHLTDDLAYRDEQGFLWFNSRKDDVILSSGYRISPAEIEAVLTNHDAVLEVGVIGIPHGERGEIPKAFVEVTEDAVPSDGLQVELQDFVKAHLAKFEYPRALEFVDEVPTTSTGKVERQRLREREHR